MQETRYNDEIRQKIFNGKTQEEIEAMMNADLRDGEEVIRRRELTQAEFNGYNRHERRKMAKLARKKR